MVGSLEIARMRTKPGEDDGYASPYGSTGGETAPRAREQHGKGSVRLIVRHVRALDVDVAGGGRRRDCGHQQTTVSLLESDDSLPTEALVERIELHAPGYLAEFLRATVRPWTSSTGLA